MVAQENLDKILDLIKYWEDNRDILESIYDRKFVDDKAAEMREKEKKFRDQQSNIIHDRNVLNICVAGDFNTGKSTFINSLLGEALLGMKIIPATAKVTALTYGPETRFFKFTDKTSERIEISREEFDGFSVKTGEGKNMDAIDHFEVTLPNDLLKKINIYDTPGFNTAEFSDMDDALTDKQIAKSDLVLWLSICSNGSIKQNEFEKLKNLQVPFHCILNQIDEITEDKANDVLNEFKEQIRKISDHSRVFLYAAKPILDYSLSLTVVKDTIAKKIQNAYDDKDFNLQIKNQVIIVNGKAELELPKPINSRYKKHKSEFLEYLEGCILNKEEMRKYEQIRLDKITKQYYSDLLLDLKKAQDIAKKRIRMTKNTISKTRKKYKQDIKIITQRVEMQYDNFKKILSDKLKENGDCLYHQREYAIIATDNDYHEESSKHVCGVAICRAADRFAESLIKSFKEEYSLDDNLEEWRDLFHYCIHTVIKTTIESIPRKIKIKGINSDELLSFKAQQLDNIIPDELFFSLLNLHCRMVKEQKLQRDIDHLEILVHAIEKFTKSTSDLLNKLDFNDPFDSESLVDSAHMLTNSYTMKKKSNSSKQQ